MAYKDESKSYWGIILYPVIIFILAMLWMLNDTEVASAKTNRKQAIVIGSTCKDIQNTIHNSEAGTTVYLNGEYTCDTKLQFNGKAIKLTGTKGTKLVAQGQIGGLIYDFIPNSSVEITNIIFDVNSQSNVTGISLGAGVNVALKNITVTNCLDIWCIRTGELGAYGSLLMDNVTVSSSTNSTYEAVLVMNARYCLIQNNTFTNLTQSPASLALYVGTTQCVVRNNNYVNNTIRDFYSSGADSFIYDGNVTTPASSSPITARGVQIFNTKRAIFSNNTITGQNDGQSASGGFIIYDYNVGLDGHNTGQWATSSDIYIINNTINKSYSAVSIKSMYGDDKHYEKRNIVIKGNKIIDPLWKAIDIGAGDKYQDMANIEIVNNVVSGVTKVFDGGNFSITGGGASTSSSIRNVTVKGNVGLRSSAGGNSSCVFVTGAKNVIIEKNNCDGVGKGSFKDIEVNASTTSGVIVR